MSVKINIENYEAFLLDYLEGNLPDDQILMLKYFAILHPHLDIDFDEELLALPIEEECLTEVEKEFLKKRERFEILCLGSIEGQLDPNEKNELKNFLQLYPKAELILNQYEKTIFPKEEVAYPLKSDLKKSGVIRPIFWAVASAAAMVALMFFIDPYTKPKGGDVLSHEVLPESAIIYKDSLLTFNPKMSFIAKSFSFDAQKNELSNPLNPIFSDLTVPNLAVDNQEKDVDTILNNVNVEPSNEIVEVPKEEIFETPFQEELPLEVDEDENMEIAMNESSETYTLKEYLTNTAKKKLLKKEGVVNSDLIENHNVLSALAKSMDSKTKSDVAYSEKVYDDKKVTKIKIGKFEFYRSKKKA